MDETLLLTDKIKPKIMNDNKRESIIAFMAIVLLVFFLLAIPVMEEPANKPVKKSNKKHSAVTRAQVPNYQAYI